MNVTPYVKRMGDVVMAHHAGYPNLRYIAQDLATLELLLWGETTGVARPADKLPFHTSHPLFVENKVRFFVDPWPWIEHLRGVDFAFGTRIHGNIAALLAGTPAAMSSPMTRGRWSWPSTSRSRTGSSTDMTPDTDAAELYAEADYTALNRGHAARFATFVDFSVAARPPHVFAEGEDPTRFDRRVAADRLSARRRVAGPGLDREHQPPHQTPAVPGEPDSPEPQEPRARHR